MRCTAHKNTQAHLPGRLGISMELVTITVLRGDTEEKILANPQESILSALRGEDYTEPDIL